MKSALINLSIDIQHYLQIIKKKMKTAGVYELLGQPSYDCDKQGEGVLFIMFTCLILFRYQMFDFVISKYFT